jgi:hypothetical protein
VSPPGPLSLSLAPASPHYHSTNSPPTEEFKIPCSWHQRCCSFREGFREGSGCSLEHVGAAGRGLLAARAMPDTGRHTLDGEFTAELAEVPRVLTDLDLLGDLTQRRAVTRACRTPSRSERDVLGSAWELAGEAASVRTPRAVRRTPCFSNSQALASSFNATWHPDRCTVGSVWPSRGSPNCVPQLSMDWLPVATVAQLVSQRSLPWTGLERPAGMDERCSSTRWVRTVLADDPGLLGTLGLRTTPPPPSDEPWQRLPLREARRTAVEKSPTRPVGRTTLHCASTAFQGPNPDAPGERSLSPTVDDGWMTRTERPEAPRRSAATRHAAPPAQASSPHPKNCQGWGLRAVRPAPRPRPPCSHNLQVSDRPLHRCGPRSSTQPHLHPGASCLHLLGGQHSRTQAPRHAAAGTRGCAHPVGTACSPCRVLVLKDGYHRETRGSPVREPTLW